jgi:hypothetical protein
VAVRRRTACLSLNLSAILGGCALPLTIVLLLNFSHPKSFAILRG